MSEIAVTVVKVLFLALLWLFVLDGSLSSIEGGLLFSLLLVYGVISVRSGRRESAAVAEEYREAVQPLARGQS